ncbi:hypothetical protein DOY81_007178, partial [Sarcophaga bullata]
MDKLPTETIKQSPTGNTKTIATTITTTTNTKTINESNITKANKSKRYKLQRSTENFDDHCEVVLATTPTRDNATCHVMGGGFATPPASYSTQYTPNAASDKAALLTNLSNETEIETIPTNTNKTNKNAINATTIVAKIRHNHSALDLPMHEKLLENDGCENKQPSKDKTEKLKTKSHKESKFAEKLRRSFRRAEHKSLEIKRQDKKDQGDLAAAQERSSSLRPLQPQLNNSASIFSLTNLPGLGGHINPALLLDSPDESTPPEFAYRHLSSVATTNSSTSLESNFCESPTTSISYWAWHMNNNNMGVEHSTANNTQQNQTTGKLLSNNDNRKRLEQQSSSKSDYEHATPVTTASRSCSSASESSTAAKLTRLQNFLFKSSNESSRSIQGHSNEGFTVSSFNSSSGEWENLCNLPSSSNNQPSIEEAPSLAKDNEEPSITALALTTASNADNNDSTKNYYQYTLASPNNPFLPEITARTYHSTYEEEEEDILEAQRELEDELDANVTSVKYRIGSHSAQLPTPNYSRTGSQESTHSEYGPSHSLEPQLYGQSLGSSSSAGSMASPGKHKRKLFSLSTPNKLNFPSPPLGHQQPQSSLQQQPSFTTLYNSSTHNKSLNTSDFSPTSYQQQPHKSVTKTSSCNLVRSLNPFLPSTTVTSSSPPQRTASSSSLNKRTGPLKQQAVTSPVAAPSTTATT